MEKYTLKKIDDNTYFIISLTYESILDYLEELENELAIKENVKIVLIDQLLTTGNNKNRFISCEYQNGKIMLFTAKNVECKEDIRTISSQVLKDKHYLIEKSILTKYQKQRIKEGRAI